MTTRYVVKPAAGRVAVKLAGIQEKTDGGIIIPDQHRGSPTQGVVYASCAPYDLNGEAYEPLYMPGDLVVFGEYTGTRITIGRDTIVVLKERDIIASIVEVSETLQPSADSLSLIKVHDS